MTDRIRWTCLGVFFHDDKLIGFELFLQLNQLGLEMFLEFGFVQFELGYFRPLIVQLHLQFVLLEYEVLFFFFQVLNFFFVVLRVHFVQVGLFFVVVQLVGVSFDCVNQYFILGLELCEFLARRNQIENHATIVRKVLKANNILLFHWSPSTRYDFWSVVRSGLSGLWDGLLIVPFQWVICPTLRCLGTAARHAG